MTTSKRGSLFSPKVIENDTPPPGTSTGQQAVMTASTPADMPAARYPKASTREGKKSITVYVEPETLKQLRRLRDADEDEGKDSSLQDLMVEAINALFAKRGVSRLA
jgi:hypothetical protein